MTSITTTPGVLKPSSSTARELFGLGRAQALGAVGLGDLHEVGEVLHPHFGVAARVEELLPLAHHAEAAVVHDDDLEVEVLGDAGGELLQRHLERAVSGDEHARCGRGCRTQRPWRPEGRSPWCRARPR